MFTKKKKNLRYACISEANKGKKGCLNICPQHFETHLEEGSSNLQREEKGSEFLEEGSLEENSLTEISEISGISDISGTSETPENLCICIKTSSLRDLVGRGKPCPRCGNIIPVNSPTSSKTNSLTKSLSIGEISDHPYEIIEYSKLPEIQKR